MEYQHITDLNFIKARINVLHHLSKSDCKDENDRFIYYTDWGRENFEKQAKINI